MERQKVNEEGKWCLWRRQHQKKEDFMGRKIQRKRKILQISPEKAKFTLLFLFSYVGTILPAIFPKSFKYLSYQKQDLNVCSLPPVLV